MHAKLVLIIVMAASLPSGGFGQTSPAPSTPLPSPPPPPEPWERPAKLPKVPVTFLGVETSEVPNVVREQLGLTKGFGLVVDYVVPDSPAAAAGVQQNDIIKMLNDQILTEPNQLAKLVRSYSEGTTVTLTLLRQGKEQKVSVKLAKKEVPQHPDYPEHFRGHRHSGFPFDYRDLDDLGMNTLQEQMRDLKEKLGDDRRGIIHDAVIKARQEAMRAREQAREQIQRGGDQIRILSRDRDAIKSTKIDIGKAQIVFSDDKGELRVEKLNGKKILTAKDPQGTLLYSGPVETNEDLDKVPADVRQRYEKLQNNDLPAVAPRIELDEDDVDEEDPSQSSFEPASLQFFPARATGCSDKNGGVFLALVKGDAL